MKKTTLKEIAQILNLSTSTISKALNNSNEISTATKTRVKNLADEYGYVPNFSARNLKAGKTKTIGVIIPNVSSDFFSLVLLGIEKEARRHKYKVIVAISNDKFKIEKETFLSFMNGSVDGVLISLAEETQHRENPDYFKMISNHELPIVQFDRVNNKFPFDRVTIDDFESAYTATKHLIKTGCRKIAFITAIAKTSVAKLRKQGYFEAIKSEYSPNEALVFNVENPNELKDLIKEAIDKFNIDAFLTTDELTAFCTLSTVQTLGYKVPEDISIIGFTNGNLTKYSNPPITTICQHAKNIGRIAVGTLIRRIQKQNKGYPTHKIIKTELAIRQTTRYVVKESRAGKT